MNKYFDIGTITVIFVTFLLFVVALFTKGLTHDLLLEAGVLLVSIKLIMMAYKNNVFYKEITQELKKINDNLNKKG
jgi:hypothetical protein